MKKILLIASLFLSVTMSAQIWSENFNSGTALPAGWTQESLSSDGGWSVNTASGLSSQYFNIPNSDGNVLGTNDDGCGCTAPNECFCDKSNDFIKTSAITIPAGTTPYLMFDYYYLRATIPPATEVLTVEVSADGGNTWTVLQEIAGAGGWETAAVDLADYVGTTINLAFRYNDDGGWMYGAVIDNMQITEPDLSIIDAVITFGEVGVFNPAIPARSFSFTKYLTGETVDPTIIVANNAFSPITSFDAVLSGPGGDIVETVSNLNLGYGESYTHTFAPVAIQEGANSWAVSITNVNGGAETESTNNSFASMSIEGVTPFPGRVIVGEYGTGTWCGWCVRSHTYTDYLSSIYPENFVSIAVHNGDPMVVDEYDAAMANVISGYPSGTVDRANFNGMAEVDPQDFEAALLERVAEDPGVQVSASIDYVSGDTTATINCGFNFTENVSGSLRVAVVLIEDEVSGTSSDWDQANYYAGGGSGPMGGYEALSNPVDATDMVYNHVARAIFGTYAGETGIITSNPTAGSSFTHEIIADIDPSWNMARMRAVAMVIKSGDILNAGLSAEALALEETVNNSTEFSLYPNPANNQAFLRLNNATPSDVTVTVFDMTGRAIDSRTYQNLNSESIVPINTSEYSNGMYVVKAQSATGSATKNLVVNK